MHWLLDSDLFTSGNRFAHAARAAGHGVTRWEDARWHNGAFRELPAPTLFRGSLQDADRLAQDGPFSPGAWCNTPAFRCQAWYPAAARWLVHPHWTLTTVAQLVDTPPATADQVFVRPDSPLKPFSGRVIATHRITPAHLDHGYYYDDLHLPIIVAPVQMLGHEWRFVACDRTIVAGSAYHPERRQPGGPVHQGPAWDLAAEVARRLTPPDPLYIIDIVETPDGLKLLELNPFSGADLYDCPPEPIVAAVARVLDR